MAVVFVFTSDAHLGIVRHQNQDLQGSKFYSFMEACTQGRCWLVVKLSVASALFLAKSRFFGWAYLLLFVRLSLFLFRIEIRCTSVLSVQGSVTSQPPPVCVRRRKVSYTTPTRFIVRGDVGGA